MLQSLTGGGDFFGTPCIAQVIYIYVMRILTVCNVPLIIFYVIEAI